MKKLWFRLFSHLLFWCGHLVSLLIFDFTAHVMYPIYNFFMGYSMYIQDVYDVKGPWENRNKEAENDANA